MLGVLEIVGQGGGRWGSLGAERTLWGGHDLIPACELACGLGL